jgi:hypothetical protein
VGVNLKIILSYERVFELITRENQSSPLITRENQSSLSKERITKRFCLEARDLKSSLSKERIERGFLPRNLP